MRCRSQFILAIAISICFPVAAFAQLYQTPAEQVLLMDADTGTILFSKNADKKAPPASIAKLMTVNIVFAELKAARLKLDDKFFVSENAWRTGGAVSGVSSMFAKLGSDIPLEDLLKGIIVQSANDACIVIAEGLAGSEAAFANLMNNRARKLEMTSSNFVNSTGLPATGQAITMTDMVKLGRNLIDAFPEYFSLFSVPEFEWNKVNHRNDNPLLRMDIGVDGFDTGYSEEAGYSILVTAQRNGQRLIAALGGMGSKRQRIEESRKILDWGFRAFERLKLFGKDEEIVRLPVYGGTTPEVGAVTNGETDIFLPLANRESMKGRVVYEGPLMPPISRGDKLGKLQIWIGNDMSQEVDLYASESVEKGPIHRQAIDAAKELLFGWIRFSEEQGSKH